MNQESKKLVFVTSIMKSHENARVTRTINNKPMGVDMFKGHKIVKIDCHG
jgi:hypothetical protein